MWKKRKIEKETIHKPRQIKKERKIETPQYLESRLCRCPITDDTLSLLKKSQRCYYVWTCTDGFRWIHNVWTRTCTDGKIWNKEPPEWCRMFCVLNKAWCWLVKRGRCSTLTLFKSHVQTNKKVFHGRRLSYPLFKSYKPTI